MVIIVRIRMTIAVCDLNLLVVIVGNPGAKSGRKPWHVSAGKILWYGKMRGILGDTWRRLPPERSARGPARTRRGCA